MTERELLISEIERWDAKRKSALEDYQETEKKFQKEIRFYKNLLTEKLTHYTRTLSEIGSRKRKLDKLDHGKGADNG